MHTISTSENETVLFILPVSLNNINNYNVNNQNCLSRFNFMGHKIDLKHISCSSSSLLDVHTNICLVQLSKLAIVRRRKCLDLTQLSFPVVTMKSSLLFILGLCSLISVLQATVGEVYYVLPTESSHSVSCPGINSCPPGQTCMSHNGQLRQKQYSHFFSPDKVNATLYFMCGLHNCTKQLIASTSPSNFAYGTHT